MTFFSCYKCGNLTQYVIGCDGDVQIKACFYCSRFACKDHSFLDESDDSMICDDCMKKPEVKRDFES